MVTRITLVQRKNSFLFASSHIARALHTKHSHHATLKHRAKSYSFNTVRFQRLRRDSCGWCFSAPARVYEIYRTWLYHAILLFEQNIYFCSRMCTAYVWSTRWSQEYKSLLVTSPKRTTNVSAICFRTYVMK